MIPRQVRDLVDFVGSGRKLTDKGNLTLADGKALVTVLGTSDTVEWQHGEARGSVRSSQNLHEVDLVFRLAMAAGFLEQPDRERSASVPRPGCSRASPSRRRTGCSRRRSSRSGLVRPTTARTTTDSAGSRRISTRDSTRLLLDLYVGTEPLAIDEFTEEFWEDLQDLYDLDGVEEHKLEMHRRLIECSACRALRRLRSARGRRRVGHRNRAEAVGRKRRIRRHGHAHPVGHVAGPSDAGRGRRRAGGRVVGRRSRRTSS